LSSRVGEKEGKGDFLRGYILWTVMEWCLIGFLSLSLSLSRALFRSRARALSLSLPPSLSASFSLYPHSNRRGPRRQLPHNSLSADDCLQALGYQPHKQGFCHRRSVSFNDRRKRCHGKTKAVSRQDQSAVASSSDSQKRSCSDRRKRQKRSCSDSLLPQRCCLSLKERFCLMKKNPTHV
jgi:hypothetical protein